MHNCFSFMAILLFVLSSTFASAQQNDSRKVEYAKWLNGKSEPYKSTKSIDQAIETLKHQFVDEGLSDFVPLLSKERIIRAIENSLAAEAKGRPKENIPKSVDTKNFHELWIPRLNEIAKKNKWPEGSFLALNSHTIPNYCEHVNVQLFVRSDSKKLMLFNLPVLDIKFGQWLPLQATAFEPIEN